MLADFLLRVGSAANSSLRRYAASQVERNLRELLIEAVDAWRAAGFSRFDDGEVSCTVRLYACCRVVLAASPARMMALVESPQRCSVEFTSLRGVSL